MVPKIHKRGTSFKGAAAYLLHDKDRASTAERVAWVETRNLATDKPDLAWRIMAATALDQNRLKDQAGIKATGRKSRDHVLHLSLAWHPDEAKDLSPEEMVRAALGVMRALSASDHQAMIISHSDEKQPHVHILINRVSPEDGRILSSSKEKENLSRWAEKYEKERGRVFCQERVLNNAARRRGEFTRGRKDRPRHILEAERSAANDNPPSPSQAAVFTAQKTKDTALAKKARATKARHLQELEALEHRYNEQRAAIKERAAKAVGNAKRQVRQDYRPKWDKLLKEHQEDVRDFDGREQSFIGRVKNAARSIDFSAILSGTERRQAIAQAFGAFASAGSRLAGVRRKHEAQERVLAGQQKQAERKAASPALLKLKDEISSLASRYTGERSQFTLAHAMDAAALRSGWKTRAQERGREFAATEPIAHYRELARDDAAPGRKDQPTDKALEDYRDLLDGSDSRDKDGRDKPGDRER